MYQLIYVSEASEGLQPSDIFRIVEVSARNNPSADITGFLIYRDGQFFQLVEGPLMSLEALVERLEGDPRHHAIRILDKSRITERRFPKWRMKRLAQGDGKASLALLEQALSAEGADVAILDDVRPFLGAFAAA